MDDSAESWINYDFTKLDPPPPTNAGGLNYITIWFLAGLVRPQRLSQDPKMPSHRYRDYGYLGLSNDDLK